jgi:polar amino acid transport system substrate-binding protein
MARKKAHSMVSRRTLLTGIAAAGAWATTAKAETLGTTVTGVKRLPTEVAQMAQQAAESDIVANAFAPTGRLRIAVWTVPYFAVERAGQLEGLIPDLGGELARRLGVPATLTGYATPGALIEAFRRGEVDTTFVGITADRAQVIDFGPVVLDIQTSYLVPPTSTIQAITDIDRADVRILVPARSAQEAHLKGTIARAKLIPVAPENPDAAIAMLAAGAADAFSHVAPVLAAAQSRLPGARILPGSYFNVPIAIGVAKGRSAAVQDFARRFAVDVKASGFVRQAIARAGVTGIVPAAP